MDDSKAGQAVSQRSKCFRSRMMTAYDLLRKENLPKKVN